MRVVCVVSLLLCCLAVGSSLDIYSDRRGVVPPLQCAYSPIEGVQYWYTCSVRDYDLRFGRKEKTVGKVKLVPVDCGEPDAFGVNFEIDFSLCNPWEDSNCDSFGKCFSSLSFTAIDQDLRTKEIRRRLKSVSEYESSVIFEDCGVDPFDADQPSQLNLSWTDTLPLDPSLTQHCVYLAGHSDVQVQNEFCTVNYNCLAHSDGAERCINYVPRFVAGGDFNSYWQVRIMRNTPDTCGDSPLCEDNTPICAEEIETLEAYCVDAGDTLGSQCRHGRLVSSIDLYERYLIEGDAGHYPIGNPENLAAVNFLLNAKFNSNGQELQCGILPFNVWQHAFWQLLDTEDYDRTCRNTGCSAGDFDIYEERVDCIVEKALEKGTDWRPSCESVFGVILVGSTCETCGEGSPEEESSVQDLMVVMEVQKWGCPCLRSSKKVEGYVFPQCESYDDGCTEGCPDYAPFINKQGECTIPPSKWKPYLEYCCDIVVEGEIPVPDPSPQPEPCPVY